MTGAALTLGLVLSIGTAVLIAAWLWALAGIGLDIDDVDPAPLDEDVPDPVPSGQPCRPIIWQGRSWTLDEYRAEKRAIAELDAWYLAPSADRDRGAR